MDDPAAVLTGAARYGVVLAGGDGRRMGGAKGDSRLHGVRLTDHVAAAMHAAGLDVRVAAKSADAGGDLEVIPEPSTPVHPLAGVASALACLNAPIVTCPCDMPFVPPAIFARLAAATGDIAVVTAHDGHVQPLLGRWTPAALPALVAAIQDGTSARATVASLGATVLDVAGVLGPEGAGDAMGDVDTPADLDRAHGRPGPGEVTPGALARMLASDSPPAVVDVREDWERTGGIIAASAHLPAADVTAERLPAGAVVLVCASGARSLAATRRAWHDGRGDVRSLAGGMRAWAFDGHPVRSADVADPLARYRRQMVLAPVGEAGQRRLRDARVLVVGAGGLGSPVLHYLAAAGVGHLGVVDDDVVDVTNLHRQVIHSTASVGARKADSAARAIGALNPDVAVATYAERIGPERAVDLASVHDVVVDASDNLATRYALNAACVATGTPLVWASIVGFEGQVGVVTPDGAPCYACVFPSPPPPEFAPDCARAGVLGPACGVVGAVEAAEVVKIIVGMGESLAGRLLMVDALTMTFTDVTVARRVGCAVCGGDGRPAGE